MDYSDCKGCWYFDGGDCICYGENCHLNEISDLPDYDMDCELCKNSYFESDKLRCRLLICKPDYPA